MAKSGIICNNCNEKINEYYNEGYKGTRGKMSPLWNRFSIRISDHFG